MQVCPYDSSRRGEYLAAAAATAAAARENSDLRQQRQQEPGTKGGHVGSTEAGSVAGVGGTDGLARFPPRVGAGVGGSCRKDGDDDGVGISGNDGGAAGAGAGARAGAGVPPFARLRERTFDMTKRGELTSANVWYATMRREQGVTIAGGGGGGSSVGGEGGRGGGSSSSGGCRDVGRVEGASRNNAKDGGSGASADGGGVDGVVGADDVELTIP